MAEHSSAIKSKGFSMVKDGKIKRYRRFRGWDYTKGVSLFITIATASRRPLFGEVVCGFVVLSPLGEKVKEALEAIPRLNPGILLFGYVVMPDHVHFNCALLPGLEEPLKVLGNAIRRFKNYTTKLAKHSLAIKSSGPEFGNASRFDRRAAERFDGRTVFGQIGQSSSPPPARSQCPSHSYRRFLPASRKKAARAAAPRDGK